MGRRCRVGLAVVGSAIDRATQDVPVQVLSLRPIQLDRVVGQQNRRARFDGSRTRLGDEDFRRAVDRVGFGSIGTLGSHTEGVGSTLGDEIVGVSNFAIDTGPPVAVAPVDRAPNDVACGVAACSPIQDCFAVDSDRCVAGRGRCELAGQKVEDSARHQKRSVGLVRRPARRRTR